MIDTHCHLTSSGLFEQVDDVVARAHAAGVDRMISVATSPDDARQAVALAQRFDSVHATVGIHPHEAASWQDAGEIRAAYEQLVFMPQVVAVGEMGLDWYYKDPPRDVQRRCFEAQLQIIADLRLTKNIVIHNRQATDDTLAMIQSCGIPGERFVFHCFTGSAAELEQILALGAWVSFTGIVTFKNSNDLAAASDLVPMDRLMVETDAPYLTPEPYRKVRPNEPRYVPEVARFLAARRGEDNDAFVQRMDDNALRFYGV